MKKVLMLLALTPLFYVAKGQDTIANPGFERWSNFGSYEDPNTWKTLNPLTSVVGAVVAYKATGADAHSGSNAIKLVTKTVLGNPTPSLVTTGTVNVQQQSVDGGAPISARPLFFTGWYKYAPQNGDTASFSITLTKWNGTSRDVVGEGGLYVNTDAASYTSFSIPISYALPDVPDTVQIIMVSSSNAAPQLNSILFIDDVDFDFSTGIMDSKVEGLNLYPNPANGVATLQFNLEGTQGIDITILNAMGQNVKSIYSGKSNGGLNQVQFSTQGLPTGIYSVRLNMGTKTYTEKLVVN
jgi:hypothetical protein